MPTLGRLLLLFASLLLGPLVVMADELPKDTNKIESLTVEQARKLVREFPVPGGTVTVKLKGHSEIEPQKSLPILESPDALPLNGLGFSRTRIMRARTHDPVASAPGFLA